MLANSIFSFFHNVFYPSQNKFHLLSDVYFVVCKYIESGVVFSPFLNKPLSFHVCSTRLLKILRKMEIRRNDQFLLFQQFLNTILLENSPPFSSNSKLSYANIVSLEASKICCFGKGYTFTTLLELATLMRKALKHTCIEKNEKILTNCIFSFFHNIFNPSQRKYIEFRLVFHFVVW